MLSVIIPFHNAAKYIENCLNLLKKQTLKDDYEVLFINDGSTDNSADIFNKLNFDTARIRLINLPKSGVSKARNIGINESKGDYLLILRSIESHFISTIILNKLEMLSDM